MLWPVYSILKNSVLMNENVETALATEPRCSDGEAEAIAAVTNVFISVMFKSCNATRP